MFVGWLTPLLALAAYLLVRLRNVGLAALLGIGAVVPVLLALGTNLPLYEPLYEALPPLRFPRVPERLTPIARPRSRRSRPSRSTVCAYEPSPPSHWC